jgi:hypothetical protein
MATHRAWKDRGARGVLFFDPRAKDHGSTRDRYVRERFGTRTASALSRNEGTRAVVAFVLLVAGKRQQVARRLEAVVRNSADLADLIPDREIWLEPDDGFGEVLPFLQQVGTVSLVRGNLPGLAA